MKKINLKDIINIKHGRLTPFREVEEHLSPSGGISRMFYCLCDCGSYRNVALSDLRRKGIKSCGCYNKEQLKKSVTSHGLSNTRIYNIYKKIIIRCNKENSKYYKNYGQRGIKVCKEWLCDKGLQNFYNWSINNGYNDNLSIDRINNDDGYSPENCRWATRVVQNCNQRKRKDNSSWYTGIGYVEKINKYSSRISVNGKRIVIGYLKTKKEALEARNDYIVNNNLIHKLQKYVKN